jgi:transposase
VPVTFGVGFLSSCRPVGVLAGVWLERGESTIDPNQECPPRFTVYAKEGIVFVMIGIDPHKATHTAVAVDDDENVIDEFTLEASKDQTERLTGWADQFAKREWAVESANGLGYLIARQLVAAGETVFDVPPVLASRVRLMGSGKSQKNDPNDARAIAIAALRSDRLATVRCDDHVTVLRLLVKRHRDMARLRNKHCSRLHALLIELEAGGIGGKISVTNASVLLDRISVANEATRYRILVAREVVDDIARLDATLRASKKRIAVAVTASGTSLMDIVGVGPIGAATIIGYTKDITRFPTRGHYATYNATAPIEVSSAGNTRHRLNLRGNRILNHAIHIAAVTQLRHDTNGRIYFDKKIAEGKTPKEAIRALKRRISDAVYRALITDTRRTPTT